MSHQINDLTTTQQVFFGTWVVLAICGAAMWIWGSAAFKRKAWPIFVVIVGILFVLFAYLMGGSKDLFFVVGPVALITFLNLTTVKFCPKCGTMNRNPYMFPVPKYCSQCMTSLDAHGKTPPRSN